MEDIIKGVRPFMAARLIVLLLLILFPAVVSAGSMVHGLTSMARTRLR